MPKDATTQVLAESARVFVIDDDPMVSEALSVFLESNGLTVRAYNSAKSFLGAYQPDWSGCLVLDYNMPDMNGLELQQVLAERGVRLPIIFLTGQANVPTAVQAIKDGAITLLEKPAENEVLLGLIQEALLRDAEYRTNIKSCAVYMERAEALTPREREVFILITKGLTNKQVAKTLNISDRTAEAHRCKVMRKMEASSLADLISMVYENELLQHF